MKGNYAKSETLGDGFQQIKLQQSDTFWIGVFDCHNSRLWVLVDHASNFCGCGRGKLTLLQ